MNIWDDPWLQHGFILSKNLTHQQISQIGINRNANAHEFINEGRVSFLTLVVTNQTVMDWLSGCQAGAN